ncbi:MAG: hypothetical protein R3C25_04015 [Hyphomonadaceae bacterium]
MQRAAPLFALVLALACANCSPATPPAELSGLWGAGAAACAAGVGVRFQADTIEVVYGGARSQTLFDHPRYQQLAGENFRVRITYQLPEVAGGARVAGAHGVLVLARQPGGGVAPESHSLIDPRTGAARIRLLDDPAVRALTLSPCGDHPWREELRGRG